MSPYFYKAVGWRLFATASLLVSGVGALKLYGKYLSPELYGLVLVALQIMSYLPFLDGGFRTTVNRRILAHPGAEEKWRLIRFCQVFYTWIGLAMAGAAVLVMFGYGMTPHAREAGQPLMLFLALGLVGGLTGSVFAQLGLLVGLQSQASLFFLTGVNAWVWVTVLWLGLRSGFGLWAFPLSALAGLAVIYPLGLWFIRTREPGVRFFGFRLDAEFWGEFHRLKGDAWACVRTQVATLLLFSLDVILVFFLAGAAAAATYGVLTRVFGILRNFVQASGEAAWPIVAREGPGSKGFGEFLIRGNAWVYASVTGAACLTLNPFLEWFMGENWVQSTTVLWLVAARFLVTGLASSVTYVLYGLGEFRLINRYFQRELGAALILGIPLGLLYGVEGFAAGLLGSTLFGTFYPIIRAYAVQAGQRPWDLFRQIWWRSLAGLGLSGLTAGLLFGYFSTGLGVVGVGVAGFLAGLAAGLAVALVRFGTVQGLCQPKAIYACIKKI